MKKRKDSFFGLHFDFHAQPKYGVQGVNLKEEDIRELCQLIKPDFIQIDCKGHPGWASYPSELGNAMPEFAQDTLALWRRVTKEEGVALYMHYSGIFEIKYCSEHPEDTVMNADGKLHNSTVRSNSKYADELLIPQLSELAEKYGVDGVWVDGDCWRARADFSPETLADFEKETGIDLDGRLPATPEDPYYYEYRDYTSAKAEHSSGRYIIMYSTSADWKESSFTWDTQPEKLEKIIAFVDTTAYQSNQWVEIDITEYVKNHAGEVISIVLCDEGKDNDEGHVDFASREQQGREPKLVVLAG